ncbi:DUF1648 domain-containing protein [Neolewinella aurantiaca]|uniref:DUF1648 domain-containing protein n=1 Tax=Neolewinella aurantiaca TaxID=2602767 RepID=A0A5C7FN58_9BACT|nr:SdpI family protein [Neolewinella aurantiaca]TXF88924.1 DUF1648 domain-containing protein [Neolewinella aurantiaca]
MKNIHLITSLLFVFLPFIYLASIYGGLPEQIPIHFDWRGQPDGWGPKYILWLLPTIMVPMVMLIMAAIQKKIAKREAPEKSRAIGTITLIFVSLITCYIIHGAEAGSYAGLGGLSVLMGLFFGAMGNYLPVLRKNPYIGIRVPPTMSSEEKWTKTHRFAGPLFLLGGVLMVINGLLLGGGTVTVVLLIIVGAITLIPVVYAYRLPDEEDGDLV